MKYDPTIHHRSSIRLPGFDYTHPGSYFITIVAYGREDIFGQISDGNLQLNGFGRIANREWLRLPSRFSHIQLDAFITMPNHIHGILSIVEDEGMGTAGPFEDKDLNASRRAPTTVHEQFGIPIPGSLPTIMRSYKSAVALRINRLRSTPAAPVWQRNYYEHVIRKDAEWDQIRTYIEANPLNWRQDELNVA